MNILKVAVIGHGVVGSGVSEILINTKKLYGLLYAHMVRNTILPYIMIMNTTRLRESSQAHSDDFS